MKIALFDPYIPKFTEGMIEHWRAKGHEVRTDRYYDPEAVAWADVVWFDTCDNNLKSATNPSEALIDDWQLEGKTVPWALQEQDLTGKKIIVRPIDIEVWLGHQDGSDWSVVTDCIFIAPHIRDLMMASEAAQKSDMTLHTIPCAVDINKYSFREHKPGFNIGIVSEVWESKGVDYVLQIALKLKRIDERYNISWTGKFQDHSWDIAYTHDFIHRNKLNINFYDWVDSIDEFLEDKDYLLHASKKEAFSYATAEAMAKGIKPVLHHFYGADRLWPNLTWDSIDEAVDLIIEPEYDSNAYRGYLHEHGYTLPQMMDKIDAVIGA